MAKDENRCLYSAYIIGETTEAIWCGDEPVAVKCQKKEWVPKSVLTFIRRFDAKGGRGVEFQVERWKEKQIPFKYS